MSKSRRKKTGKNHKEPEKSSSAAVVDNSINEGDNRIESQYKNQKHQDTNNESFWEKEKHWEWAGVGVNTILAVLTLGLFYIAIKQTDAAKDSLAVLKESLVADVRIDDDATGTTDYGDSVRIRFKNFGNLPAKDVWIYFSSDRRPSDFPDSILSYRNRRHYDFIYPGETKEIIDKPVLDFSDQSNLFLHFKITYFAFEKSISRIIGLEQSPMNNDYADCKHSK